MTLETRPFGRTGRSLPVLGLGCQRLVDTAGCREAEAVALLGAAVEQGIRAFDAAPVYGLGQAERRLGLAARGRRDTLWIATKTRARTRAGALADLDASLQRLGTSWVDEWRLHDVGSLEELDLCCAPGGALEALAEARRDGRARLASVSGHADPAVLVEALRRFPFDSVLVPLSALDSLRASFEEGLLPEASARGVAAVGMKVHAHGALRHVARDALRYVLGLPVALALVGPRRPEELEACVAAAALPPMGEAERAAFAASLAPLLAPRTLPWKSKEWGRGGWLPLSGGERAPRG